MILRRPVPSPKVQELAGKAARDVSSAALKVRSRNLHSLRKDLAAADPLNVYVLGTLAVIEDADLHRAVPAAWRFLVFQGKHSVAAAEVTLEKSERGPRWTHTSYDSRHRRQLEVIENMLANPTFAKKNYELRFLRIPGLDLKGLLWFHSRNGAEDRVVQLEKNPILRAGWPYPVEQLLARLRPYAERRRRPVSGRSSRLRPGVAPLVQVQPPTAVRKKSRGGRL